MLTEIGATVGTKKMNVNFLGGTLSRYSVWANLLLLPLKWTKPRLVGYELP